MNPSPIVARADRRWGLVAHLSFEAPVEPEGKARARATTIGGKPRLYTPKTTVAYETALATFAKAAMLRAGLAPATGPLRVDIDAWFARPKSHAKGRGASVEPHTSKPDKDNVEKAVLDALSGIAWSDDARIAQGETSKWWLPHGVPARVAVSVWRMVEQ